MAGVPSGPSPLRCPCGSGDTYPDCCGRLHAGSARAATAEALMRSRYSAFAVGERDYLLATWDPTTRPSRLDLDDRVQWLRLEIVETIGGGPFDRDGVVEFRAYYRTPAGRGTQRERSRFRRVAEQWCYLAGESGPS